MIAGIEALACQGLAVPADVMHHVVRVESSYNPFAIGVVGTRLARQPRNLAEAVATARQLERDGFNFSLGLAQVNLHNLARQGLDNYELAFDPCPNLSAGSRILAECHVRAGGNWDKAFSCYYSGNFTTGFRDGYVQKIRASMAVDAGADAGAGRASAIAETDVPGIPLSTRRVREGSNGLVGRRGAPQTGHLSAAPPPPEVPVASTFDVRAEHPAEHAFVPAVSAPAMRPGGRQPPEAMSTGHEDGAFVF
jgi:type IV secretion system protein VirB1